MKKGIVIYDSKYGNTKIVAEKIVEEVNAVGNIEMSLSHVKDVGVSQMLWYDIIVIGAPNHMGRPTRVTRKFVKRLGRTDLRGKKIAFFDTCLKGEEGKATGVLEKTIRGVAPHVRLIKPSLSVLVDGMKGSVTQGETPKIDGFGEIIVLSV